MGDNSIPTFDHTVKWKKRAEKGERRIPNYRNREDRETNYSQRTPTVGKVQDAGPTSQTEGEKTGITRPAIMRQRSETNNLESKRPKIDGRTTELPADDEQMDNEEL